MGLSDIVKLRRRGMVTADLMDYVEQNIEEYIREHPKKFVYVRGHQEHFYKKLRELEEAHISPGTFIGGAGAIYFHIPKSLEDYKKRKRVEEKKQKKVAREDFKRMISRLIR